MNETPENPRDPLDQSLAALARDVPPSRDLWPAISAQLSQPVPLASIPKRATWSPPWLQLAAGLLLVVGSSLITYLVMQRAHRQEELQARQATEQRLLQAPPVPVMPASFGAAATLGTGYMQARASLDAEFQRRVTSLPPATRAKVEGDLAELRRAASDIAATLALHPDHPLLQELLLSSYQSELALLSSVNEMVSTETRL